MASEKFEAPDLQKFIASLRPDADHLDDLWRRPEPQLLPVPSVVRLAEIATNRRPVTAAVALASVALATPRSSGV